MKYQVCRVDKRGDVELVEEYKLEEFGKACDEADRLASSVGKKSDYMGTPPTYIIRMVGSED